MKYAARAQPLYGAMYCRGAASSAVEPTTQVKVTKNIKDLADFAQEHGISYKTLKRFNPWLRQTSLKVGKHKTYYIAIPENKQAYK